MNEIEKNSAILLRLKARMIPILEEQKKHVTKDLDIAFTFIALLILFLFPPLIIGILFSGQAKLVPYLLGALVALGCVSVLVNEIVKSRRISRLDRLISLERDKLKNYENCFLSRVETDLCTFRKNLDETVNRIKQEESQKVDYIKRFRLTITRMILKKRIRGFLLIKKRADASGVAKRFGLTVKEVEEILQELGDGVMFRKEHGKANAKVEGIHRNAKRSKRMGAA